MAFKFENTFLASKNCTVIFIASLFDGFQLAEDLDELPLRNSQNIGVVGHISAKSAKYQLLIEIHCACNLFNPHQILTVGGEYIQVLEKTWFIKKYLFLRKLSTLQKGIIGWRCIISRWMTVPLCSYFHPHNGFHCGDRIISPGGKIESKLVKLCQSHATPHVWNVKM